MKVRSREQNNITTSKNFLSKMFTEKRGKKNTTSPRGNMKNKLATMLGAGNKKKSQASHDSRGGSSDHRDRSESDVIDKMADLKVSNPLFVGASKISNHSFIRYVKAESQCHPKPVTSPRQVERNISDGVISSHKGNMATTKNLITLRRLS